MKGVYYILPGKSACMETMYFKEENEEVYYTLLNRVIRVHHAVFVGTGSSHHPATETMFFFNQAVVFWLIFSCHVSRSLPCHVHFFEHEELETGLLQNQSMFVQKPVTLKNMVSGQRCMPT